jgi:hypothetical protein
VSKQTEILCEIVEERGRQDMMHGQQEWPIKSSSRGFARTFEMLEREAKDSYVIAESTGNLTWYDIAWEEFCEVFAATDPKRQREELLQLTAVNLAMIEYLDRRYPKKDE